MRIIGLDIHRTFAEAVAWEDGKVTRLGRIDMRRDRLDAFAATLSKEDVVVVEATGNAAAVAGVIGPHVKRVVIARQRGEGRHIGLGDLALEAGLETDAEIAGRSIHRLNRRHGGCARNPGPARTS